MLGLNQLENQIIAFEVLPFSSVSSFERKRHCKIDDRPNPGLALFVLLLCFPFNWSVTWSIFVRATRLFFWCLFTHHFHWDRLVDFSSRFIEIYIGWMSCEWECFVYFSFKYFFYGRCHTYLINIKSNNLNLINKITIIKENFIHTRPITDRVKHISNWRIENDCLLSSV